MLSTGIAYRLSTIVDKSPPASCPPARIRLGIVVPKRLARRATTRSLVKRQIRSSVCRYAHRIEPGTWVIRLRSAFDARQFSSAASSALRAAVRAELGRLLESMTSPIGAK
jgi:ribonuclease P protein component